MVSETDPPPPWSFPLTGPDPVPTSLLPNGSCQPHDLGRLPPPPSVLETSGINLYTEVVPAVRGVEELLVSSYNDTGRKSPSSLREGSYTFPTLDSGCRDPPRPTSVPCPVPCQDNLSSQQSVSHIFGSRFVVVWVQTKKVLSYRNNRNLVNFYVRLLR